MRYLRLDAYLRQALEGVGAVYIEEVRRHAGTSAAHVYGGILATVQKRCEAQCIPYASIPVGTIKKAATGKGNANKTAMIAAAREKWSSVEIEDDNHADALWIAHVGGQQWLDG
jgi:Holliday junction resolvasome RuvABC endonuclease subunit